MFIISDSFYTFIFFRRFHSYFLNLKKYIYFFKLHSIYSFVGIEFSVYNFGKKNFFFSNMDQKPFDEKMFVLKKFRLFEVIKGPYTVIILVSIDHKLCLCLFLLIRIFLKIAINIVDREK